MVANFIFNYLPQPYVDSSGNTVDFYRPFIPIRLSCARKIGQYFYALIDSGSDTNLFPAGLGIVLGLNIKKGKIKNIGGIGDSKLTAYTHKVSLYIGTKKFDTEVDFSYNQEVPLLGRQGFFNLFGEIKLVKKLNSLSS